MPSFSQIAVLTAVVLAAQIRDFTLDIITPLTADLKSILAAAVSEVSALADTTPSTILSTQGCARSRLFLILRQQPLCPRRVISVPEDDDIRILFDVNYVFHLIASVLSMVTTSLGAVPSAVHSSSQADVDVIAPLLHDAMYVNPRPRLHAISSLVAGLLIALAPPTSGLMGTLESLGWVFDNNA
ncbi:hypothetical protein C8R44DRAFT_740085 [Mycena epipterygia]|nr:hypothetical protein C8R44DRAFT_740085 [Mycena epipterygia]